MSTIIQAPSPLNFSNNKNPHVVFIFHNGVFNTRLDIIRPNGGTSSYQLQLPMDVDDLSQFDPSYVIRDFIEDDINYKTTKITPATNSIIQSRLRMDGSVTYSIFGTVYHTYDSYTSSYCLSINAEKPHLEYRNTNPYDYVMGVTPSGKFLTNSPNEKDIDNGEYETLSFLYLKPVGGTSSLGYSLMKGYDFNGNLTGVEFVLNSIAPVTNTYSATISNYQNARLDLPVGLANIETINPNSILLDDTTTKYTVQLMSFTSSGSTSSPVLLPINFVEGADEGMCNNMDGVTYDLTGQITVSVGGGLMTINTDDATNPIDSQLFLDIELKDLIPSMVYKLTFDVIGGDGGVDDILYTTLNGLSDMTVLNAVPLIQPQLFLGSQSYTGYYRTGADTSGTLRFTYGLDEFSFGDRIGFQMDNFKLQALGTSSVISEVRTFNKNTICWRYEKQRVMWLNSYGAYDFFTFKSIANGTTEVTKDMYSKPLPWNYTSKDRNDTVYNVSYQKTHTLNTGIIDRSTITWLEDLYKSPKVFLIGDNGDLTPVTITSESFNKYIKGRDRVVSFDIDMIEAIKNNGVR